jgi:hypothetical protein
MNIEADLPGRGWSPAVQREIDQILQMWRVALQASGGPFLFGAFGLGLCASRSRPSGGGQVDRAGTRRACFSACG